MTEKLKYRKIIPAHGDIQRLADEFNVSTYTVRKALRYDDSVKLGQLIREAAINRGAIQI